MFSTVLLCLFYFWGPLATFSRPPLGSQDPSLKTTDLMYLWLSQPLLLSSAHIQPVWEGPSAPQHPLNAHSCGTGSKPNPWCLCSPWHLSASMQRRPGVALVSFLQSCLTCTWCLCLNIRLLFNSNQVCCLKWPRGLWEKNDKVSNTISYRSFSKRSYSRACLSLEQRLELIYYRILYVLLFSPAFMLSANLFCISVWFCALGRIHGFAVHSWGNNDAKKQGMLRVYNVLDASLIHT